MDEGGAPALSQDTLPSQLDLGSDEETEQHPQVAAGAASECGFALSEALGEVMEDIPKALDDGSTSAAAEPETVPGDAPLVVPQAAATNERVSVFERKGRRNEDLRGAMARALALASGSTSATTASAPPNRRAEIAPRQHAATPSAATLRQQRQDIVRAATVHASELGSLLKRPIAGLGADSPAGRAVFAAARLAELPGERLDAEVLSAGPRLLGDVPLVLASKRMRSEDLQVPEDKLGQLEECLSSAAVLLDRHERVALEKRVAEVIGKQGLLLYIDAVAYDETPLPVALKRSGLPDTAQAGDAAKETRAGSFGPQCTLAPGSTLGGELRTTQGPQKIFSMVQAGGLFFRCGERRCAIISYSLTSLMMLERGNAEGLRAAALQTCAATLAAGWFQQRVRAVCTDRCSANMAAERMIAADRGPSWSSVHLHCTTHKVSTAHEQTFILVDDHIKGMIHCVLSLQSGSAMDTFRRCMREEIASRLRVRRGVLPPSAIEYKKFIMRLFVSHGSRLAMRRLLLALCPNGDWRADEVEVYVAPGLEVSHERLCDHVSSGMVAALASSQPALYRRARWTGADVSTDALGVLESCHRLLSTSFMRFAATFLPSGAARRVLGAAAGAVGIAAGAEAEAPEEDCGLDQALPVGAGDLVDMVVEGSAPVGAVDPREEEPNWAAINSKHRRLAAAWIATRPLGLLMVQRAIMEPLRHLMVQQLTLAGDEWEQQQRVKLASKLLVGTASFEDREHRLAIAAGAVQEKRCLQQLLHLLSGDALWKHLPTNCHTIDFQALAFRLASRAGCMVFELLVVPVGQFPLCLFQVLADPTLAATFARAPACLLDAWSQEVLRRYPGFEGDELLEQLALLSQLLWKDISQIESRHATIRRLLKLASHQTHTQEFQDLSTQWCLLQFRRRGQRLGKGARHHRHPRQKALIAGVGVRLWMCLQPCLSCVAARPLCL